MPEDVLAELEPAARTQGPVIAQRVHVAAGDARAAEDVQAQHLVQALPASRVCTETRHVGAVPQKLLQPAGYPM